jgi:hypothetical protein
MNLSLFVKFVFFIKYSNLQIPISTNYACHSNKERNAIHAGCFMLHLQNTHQKILTHQPLPLHTVIIKGGLQWTSTGNEVRATMSKLIYESCGDHYCTVENKKIDPFLCLYKGCELLLGENVDVLNGLANGTRGIFKGYKLKPGEQLHATCVNGYFVNALFANQIEALVCTHVGSKYRGEFQVEPKKNRCVVQIPNPLLEEKQKRIKQPIQIFQVPLIHNLATTGHKLQGQTKDTIVVSDLFYGSNWMYVILSRVKTRNGLFLRNPINASKLMNQDSDGRLKLHEQWLRDTIPLR